MSLLLHGYERSCPVPPFEPFQRFEVRLAPVFDVGNFDRLSFHDTQVD